MVPHSSTFAWKIGKLGACTVSALLCCVSLPRSLSLSEPQFPHFNLISPLTSLGGLWVPSISTFAEGKVGLPPDFLCWPPGATVTNDHKLGNENHRNVFSPGSGGPKSRCKQIQPPSWFTGGCYLAMFSPGLSVRCACRGKDRFRDILCLFLLKGAIHAMGTSPDLTRMCVKSLQLCPTLRSHGL